MNKADTNNNKKVETNGGKTSSKDSHNNNVLPEQLNNALEEHQDVHINDAGRDRERKLSNILQQHVLNVFEDGIFDFLDSMNNSGNVAEKPNVKNEQNNEFSRAKALEAGAIPKHSWRSSSNGNTHTAQAEQWRRNTNDVKPNQYTTPKSTLQTQVPNTQSIIQSGATFTGVGIRPCPTYELNNMYLKFPHLKSEKVLNPLKPSQTHKPMRMPTSSHNAQNNSVGFDKVNKECATNFRDQRVKKSNSVHGSKEVHELTNSLSSLNASNKNTLVHRGRSSSSIDLTCVPNSTQKKDVRKPSAQHKSQSTDDKSKGAIPKQLSRNSTEVNINESRNSLDEVKDSPVDAQKLESKCF